jgi:hypothetical protein
MIQVGATEPPASDRSAHGATSSVGPPGDPARRAMSRPNSDSANRSGLFDLGVERNSVPSEMPGDREPVA